MKKRIFRWICTLLAVAMLSSSFALADTQPDAIGSIISGMSLRDKLAQMMLFSIRTWKEDASSDTPAENVRVLNDYIRQYIADHRFGGILLFSENCGDAEQVVRLVSDLQTVNQAGGGLPMLMAMDQEGGTVSRLGFGTSGTGNMSITATGDPENARTMGQGVRRGVGPAGRRHRFRPCDGRQ